MTVPSSFAATAREGRAQPSPAPTALVVSADPAIRSGWSERLEDQGMRTMRCVGPQVLCLLLTGESSCPLHREADFAIYDEGSVTPELLLRLLRHPPAIPIAFAKDRPGADGGHRPFVMHVTPRTRGTASCFGDLGAKRDGTAPR